MIADVLGLKKEDVDIICAGINHQTWYIQVRHHGQDMTGKLLEAFEKHPTYRVTEKVRMQFDTMVADTKKTVQGAAPGTKTK